MKNNAGVSLVTLVITIVVMLVILSITLSSSLDSIEETNMTKIENEIRTLKDAANDRMANYERNPTLYPLVGDKIGDGIIDYIGAIETLESSEITQLKVKYKDEAHHSDYHRLVGRADAAKLGVENIDVEHFYIIDYYNVEVYGPVSSKVINNT